MDDLYLETSSGITPIDAETIKKYHLEAGTRAPFTQNKIVEKGGLYPAARENEDKDSEAQIRQSFLEMPKEGIRGDGVDEMEHGFVLSQSEIIDFSQGADSPIDAFRGS